MADICPHCGHRIDDVECVELDGWRLWPNLVERDGIVYKLTAGEAGILFKLAKARGEPVSAQVLGEEFSKVADCTPSVRVMLVRIRKKLGLDVPVEAVPRRGYRWKVLA